MTDEARTPATSRSARLSPTGAGQAGPLIDLAPLSGPLTVVEKIHHSPVAPAVFEHAKLVHVMAGRSVIETESGTFLVGPGDVLVLAAGTRAWATPQPSVRTWTMYLDEAFLRQQMCWALPEHVPLKQGVPPASWDGTPLHLRLSSAQLGRLEPIFRQMSLTTANVSHTAPARLIALFGSALDVVVPALVDDHPPKSDPREARKVARPGGLPMRAEVQKTVRMIEEDLTRRWLVEELASAVALSRSHLNRLFVRHLGAAPKQLVTELRLTEFTRLIEETDLPLAAASRQVGWEDPRLASKHFARRYGVTPSRYRKGAAASGPDARA